MFPYKVSYTNCEYDIKNNDLLYKTHQQCQNTFQKIQKNRETQKSIFKKKLDFRMISVLWRFSWPAFGGAKILLYICIYIYMGECISMPSWEIDHTSPVACVCSVLAIKADGGNNKHAPKTVYFIGLLQKQTATKKAYPPVQHARLYHFLNCV